MINMRPAAERMTGLISSVTDDQLALPTPCPTSCLGDLIDHVGTFAVVFAGAARKDTGARSGPPPPPSVANLGSGWRDRISDDLLSLADAWSEPGAWEGQARAGGVDMPATVVGLVAIDELVVHGWDIAVTTDQLFDPADEEVAGAISFVASFDAPRDGKLFGPIVDIEQSARPLDRLLGLTGRDPLWQPPA